MGIARKPHHVALKRSTTPMSRGKGFARKAKTNSSRVENPQPKRKALRPRSDSTRKVLEAQWDEENRLRLEHITWCEQCGATGVTLDLAHRKKRSKIPVKGDIEATKKEYSMVAKLCRYKCHRGWDEATGPDVHQRMFDGITALIEKRKILCP